MSIEELEVPDQYYTLVTLFFNEALSLKTGDRSAAFEGLAFLLKEGPLTHAAVIKGYVAPFGAIFFSLSGVAAPRAT